jgi:SAM-dependent methyltransferase
MKQREPTPPRRPRTPDGGADLWRPGARPKVTLPPNHALPVTSSVDFVDDYHRPVFGALLRARMRWVLASLPATGGSILEIGYGSGVFQYSIASTTGLRVAVDVHSHGAAVAERLAMDGVTTALVRADGGRLPFSDTSFDAVVGISALEFMPDVTACLDEAVRVTRSGGRAIFVIPRQLAWSDRVFRMLSGVDPETDFRGGRTRVDAALVGRRDALRHRRPAWLPRRVAPYELVILHIAL